MHPNISPDIAVTGTSVTLISPAKVRCTRCHRKLNLRTAKLLIDGRSYGRTCWKRFHGTKNLLLVAAKFTSNPTPIHRVSLESVLKTIAADCAESISAWYSKLRAASTADEYVRSTAFGHSMTDGDFAAACANVEATALKYIATEQNEGMAPAASHTKLGSMSARP